MLRILLVLALAALVFAYKSMGAPLDGSAWEVKVRREAVLALSHKDTVVFDRGRFTSARALAEGYFPGGYSAQSQGDGSTFDAVLSRGDGSSVEWRGEIHGDRLNGVLISVGRSGAVQTYSFSGRRKAG